MSMSLTQKCYNIFLKSTREGRFMNSTSWVGVRAIAGLTRMGIILAIARVYGPESFGKLSLALSIVEILRMFSDFGIDTISIRRFAQTERTKRPQLLETILGARLALSVCSYAVGTAALLLLGAGRSEVLLGLIAGLSIPFSGAFGAFSSYLQSFFSMSRVLRTSILASFTSVMVAAVLVHYRASLFFVIMALPLADALNLVLLCRTSKLSLRTRFELRTTLTLLRESFPVGVTSALVTLYSRLDSLFVFRFAGAAALGLYSACFRIIEPALMIPAAFSITAYTVLSGNERSHDSIADTGQTLLRTMWPAYVFIAVVALTGVLEGKWLLAHFLPLYFSGYRIVTVFCIALLVRSVNIGLTAIFNSRAMYPTLTRIAAANVCINLALVLSLTPRYGSLGAAWAVLLTESANTFLQARSLILSRRMARSTLYQEMVNTEA